MDPDTLDGDVVMLSPEPPTDKQNCGSHTESREVQTTGWQAKMAVQTIARPDAKLDFAAHIFDIYKFWVQLSCDTTLPKDIACTDPAVTRAFQAVDRVIEGSENRLARLGHTRLIRLLATLEGIIAADRRHGRIQTSVGYRNASVALDLYIMARGEQQDCARSKLHKRTRTAKRWFHLGGNSPLLLFAHTDAAENIM